MRTIDLSQQSPSLADLLRLAREENLVILTEAGEEFILAEMDDLDQEVGLIRQQGELMALLRERSHGGETIPLREVRRNLGLPG